MAYTRVNQGELAVGGVTFGLNSIENSTAGYVLTSTGTDTNIPSWQDVSASGAVTQLEADDATIALPSAGIVTISGGATGLTTTTSGSDLSLTGVLNVAYGGTGAASLNEYELLVGNGTGAIQVIGNVSSSGIPLISKGFAAVPAYGTCTVPGGGTDKTSFTEYALVAGGTSTTGALQQVSISGASAGEVLTYVSSSALPTWQANAALQTIDGDSGSATGTTITLTALASSVNCGASVDFSATGSTVTLNVTDSSNNTFIGKGTGTASATGSSNTGLGYQSILASTGDIANTAVGYKTLSTLNGGSANTVMGGSSGLNLATGGYNTLLGYSVGANYTGSESSNIVIGALNAGSSAESHALRIGNGTGTGLGNLNAAYISGINGVTSSNPLLITINSSTDQLGVVATGNNGVLITSNSGVPSLLANGTAGYVLTANSGAPPSWQANSASGDIHTINGDSGSVTGTTVTIESNAGSSVSFDGSTSTLTLTVTDSNNSTFLGKGAGNSGTENTSLGASSLSAVTGNYNTGVGYGSLSRIVNTNYNTAIGFGSGGVFDAGEYCTLIGVNTGSNYTTNESSNILIGYSVSGTIGESNVLRIGAGTGTGSGQLNASYIAGIQGITVTGSAVLVSSSDQLGIAVSSRKYKDNIQDMGYDSSPVMSLRPVTFNYKGGNEKQYGLIAEEVAEVMPELVIYDKAGDPQTVQYHNLPAILLNEIKKLEKRVEELENSKK